VTDASGNTAVYTQTIWVNSDSQAPVITSSPADLTILCNDPVPPVGSVTATDVCDATPSVVFNQNTQAGNCPGNYLILRRWIVSDDAGNADTALQVITVRDITPPQLVGVPSNTTVSCEAVLPAPPNVTAIDNCSSSVLVVYAETANGSGCSYTVTRTWTANDGCGNVASASQLITVTDNQPPMLDGLPPDFLQVECIDDVPAPPAVTASDNCSANPSVNFAETVNGDGCFYTLTRTWTASDACGNSVSFMQTIQVFDNTEPVFVSPPANTMVPCGAIPAPPVLTATDNCDANVEVVLTESYGNGACSFLLRRIWTATDDCGNIAIHIQDITVEDNQAPMFSSLPVNETVDCSAIPPAEILTAADNCDVSPVVTFNETVNSGCPYTIVRSWVATDACGNAAFHTQIITVTDSTPPLLSANPADLTVDCGSIPAPETLTATDACDPNPAVGFGETVDNSDPCSSLITRTWTATDACGNNTIYQQTITVVDNDVPVFTYVPNDTAIYCGEELPPCGDPAVSDACTGLTVSLSTDTIPTAEGYDVICTWTATDACGHAAMATRTIHVSNIGIPVFLGVPGDTTIYVSSGETVPPAPPVTAVDTCSGAVFAPVFSENKSLAANGCDTVIVRFWEVDDGMGIMTGASQTITVVYEIQVTVNTTPDTCAFSNGSATLSPGTLGYAWSDGGTGAVRTGLAAGTYQVTVTEGTCSTVIAVNVGTVCPCMMANVSSLMLINASCGVDDGSALIELLEDEALYDFTWVPDLGTPKNAYDSGRDDLPAGHYLVVITFLGQNDCVSKVEFDINDTCPKCGPLFGVDTLSVEISTSPGAVCLPVPYQVSFDHDVFVNGEPHDQTFQPCDKSSTVFYTYSSVTGLGTGGAYAVIWQYGSAVLSTIVADMNELTAAMNAVDPAGMWFNDSFHQSIGSMQASGNYGNMTVTHLPTQTATGIQPITTMLALGSVIQLREGVHEIVYINPSTGCSDTLIVHAWMQDPVVPGGSILQEKFVLMSGNCDIAAATHCLEVPYTELSKYSFELNGQPYTGPFGYCDFFTEHFYTFSSLPGMGITGPYRLESWWVGTQKYSGDFADIDALVEAMNQWDPQGHWVLDKTTYTIGGGRKGAMYGSLRLRQISSGATVILELNKSFTPGSTQVQLPYGESSLVVTRLSDSYRDTLEAKVVCVKPQSKSTVIFIEQADTMCLEMDELVGKTVQVFNACEEKGSGYVEFDLMDGSSCVRCYGLVEGTSDACFVICDEYGICDTTYLHVEVRALQATLLNADTLHTVTGEPVVGDVLGNDQFMGMLESLTILEQPQHGSATVNPDNTITYEPEKDYCNDYHGAQFDRFFYEACVSGECLAMIVFVEVKCEDIVIHNGFSPNGDGINEFFRIKGLQKFPDNKLEIFNRWGTRVFFTENYQGDWDGTWKGTHLSDGTYFYKLETGDGKTYTGFVQIRL
jgi:gliding motility-associated-like protein